MEARGRALPVVKPPQPVARDRAHHPRHHHPPHRVVAKVGHQHAAPVRVQRQARGAVEDVGGTGEHRNEQRHVRASQDHIAQTIAAAPAQCPPTRLPAPRPPPTAQQSAAEDEQAYIYRRDRTVSLHLAREVSEKEGGERGHISPCCAARSTSARRWPRVASRSAMLRGPYTRPDLRVRGDRS